MRRALLTVALPITLLTGCISLLPEPPPPPHIYVLEAGDDISASGQPLTAVIGVAAPAGERSILGLDIVWRTGDELAIVGRSQWSHRADEALQSMLIETLMRQQRFTAATRLGEARGNYELRWEVRDFEVVDAAMSARFAADVTLVALPGRTIVAQRLIEAEAPLSTRSSSAAAAALARAAREGSARIGAFAADAVQASAASINR
jgi:cholesterol transport system auxiliary component